MGWLSYKNYAKDRYSIEKSWINSRWVWFIGTGNKDISLQITSTPNFGWGLSVDGCEGEVSINFWFILKFYITFTGVFPEWVYAREYNQFSDKEASSLRDAKISEERTAGDLQEKPSGAAKSYYDMVNKNKKLRGRQRTIDKGWIRTGERDISLKFHHYSMWWNIWRDDSSWSSDTPRWRSGSLDFVKLLKGKDKVDKEVVFNGIDEIEMPEGKYMCKIDYTKFTRKYSRWWPKSWHRFQFEFGYEDESGEWIMTPIPHWGKGTMDYNCGMDGTYSISLGSGVETLIEAKQKVAESCLKDRERYGNVDFSKVSGIEDGYVKENLIGQF